MLLEHGFQLLAAAQTYACNALALADIEQQQAACEPQPAGSDGRPQTGGDAGARVVQQMHLPVAVGQSHALQQHLIGHLRVLDVHQAAAIGQVLVDLVIQRREYFVLVLAGALQLGNVGFGQAVQQAVAPVFAAGQKSHAMGIRNHHDVGGARPLALQLLQGNLDGDQPQHLAFIVIDGAGQKVAGLARGGANAVEAPAAGAQGVLHVGAVAVVLAHIALRLVPVAGSQRLAVTVNQRQRGRLAGPVGAFELAVESVYIGCVQRAGEGITQLGVQRQHFGQGAKAVHTLGECLGTDFQLALERFALVAQRLPPGEPAHDQHAQQRACDQDADGPAGAAELGKHGCSVPGLAA